MPTTNSTGWVTNQLLHANFAYVVYDNEIIGRLDNIDMVIDKDVEYDVIIGSGGKPFGQPIVKMTKFYGTFSKGMFKESDVDKILMLDAVGNEHSDLGKDHVSSSFSSANITKFVDTDAKSLTLFPATFSSLAIAFGGVVIKKHKIDLVNNKFIRITGEFIGKFIEYYNKLDTSQYSDHTFKTKYPDRGE